MTAEVQTLNFITHQLERLPLKDSYGAEKLPALFCFRGLSDLTEKTPKRFRVSKVANTNFGEDKVSVATNSRFIYACSKHGNERTVLKSTWIDESRDLSAIVLPVKTLNGERELSKHDQNTASPNKRKRSTDSSGSDRESSKSDDEVRRIYHTETKNYKKKLHKHLTEDSRYGKDISQSDLYQKDFTCPEIKKKLHPEAKRYKNRPSLSFEQMQRSSWFPFRLRPGDRKIKVIRVSPYESSQEDSENLDVRPPVREDSLFRPISTEDL